MSNEEMNDVARRVLLASAFEMCELLRKWSFVGVPQVARDAGPDSVFRMQYETLRRTLGHLGVANVVGFYEAVISGYTPEEALARFGPGA